MELPLIFAEKALLSVRSVVLNNAVTQAFEEANFCILWSIFLHHLQLNQAEFGRYEIH